MTPGKIVKLAGPDRSLRAAAGVGSHGKSSSSPPEADGILTVTPDGPEAAEWRARKGPLEPDDAVSPWDVEDCAGNRSVLSGLSCGKPLCIRGSISYVFALDRKRAAKGMNADLLSP